MLTRQLLQPLHLGLRSLAVHKLRSALTILGVVFGVGSVIVMLAIGEGARREAIANIQELGATNIILRSVKPTSGGNNAAPRTSLQYGLTDADLQRITATIPTVVSATPMRERRQEVRYLQRKTEARLCGVTPAYQNLNHLRLRQGRFIADVDLDAQASVVVLAAQTADALFPWEDPVGRSVRIGEDRYYRVIGVMQQRGTSAAVGGGVTPQDYDLDVYLPFTTDRKQFGDVVVFHRATQQSERLEISQITVAVDDAVHVKATSRIIAGVLGQYHRQEDTALVVPLELLEKVEETQRIFTIVLGSIASISLLVGGIGIMNIMLATVTERTREIGIRRAVGARRRDITWQFLCETVVLSGAGGIVGLVLGVAIAVGLPAIFPLQTFIQLWSPLLALSISVLVGIIFGAYPARRAAWMDPIEALRHE